MAAASYGTYAPQEDQPSSMENTLAHLAYSGYSDSPAEAQTALDQYWLERQLNKQDYAAQLQDQHQFAMQQLQQQMYEANLKGLYEAGKTPGMLRIMSTSPAYQQVFGGADPNAVEQVMQQQQRSQEAVDFANTGKGLGGYASGGYVVDDPSNAASAAGSTRFIGTPAQISANARLAAAKIRAAGQTASANAPGYSIALPESFGLGSTITGKLDPNNAEAQIRQLNQLRANLSGTPQPAPSTTAVPIPINPNKIPLRAGGGGTNLPPAPQDTGGVGNQQPVNNFSIVPTTDTATMNKAKMALDSFKRSNQTAYAKMAPRGPVPTVIKDNKTGQLYIQGSDGQHYPIR